MQIKYVELNEDCRNCNHWHSIYLSCLGISTYNRQEINCDCKKWASKDNLKYLEQIYEQQNSL